MTEHPDEVDRLAGPSALVERLARPGPLVTVELRPPRSGLSAAEGMDAWIDRNHSIRNLALKDIFVFLTDDAVGSQEEENLGHLAANVGSDVPLSRLVPFLTCKHTIEHCLMYADRAQSLGFEALTVVGGDTSVGPPRCVPHSYMLRQRIRERQPGLSLGGWANTHRDVQRQVEYLRAADFSADFYLTQVVSHHSVDRVEAFLEECDRHGVDTPGIFGVFYYWSADPRTLGRLGEFFPVPAEELTREFEAGATPEEILGKTLDALRAVGAEKVYISNLGHRRVQARLAKVTA
jgi:5,10-methylenetetrahydrofolate reductase